DESASAGSNIVMSTGTLTTRVPPDGCAGGGGWTLTQTLPSATTSACGLPPTTTRPVGWSVSSSMRVSVPSPAFATQTLPSPSAIADGVLAHLIVVTTEPGTGSITLTVPSSASVTHTSRRPTVSAVGAWPTGI